jgi:hypothetical protein
MWPLRFKGLPPMRGDFSIFTVGKAVKVRKPLTAWLVAILQPDFANSLRNFLRTSKILFTHDFLLFSRD